MSDEDASAGFMALVGQIGQAAPAEMSTTGAALLAALYLGVGSDSRSLSNRLGIAHALLLREISALSGSLLHVERRDERTQRTWLELTEAGRLLVEDAASRTGATKAAG